MCACEHGHLNIAKRLLLEPHCDASIEDNVSFSHATFQDALLVKVAYRIDVTAWNIYSMNFTYAQWQTSCWLMTFVSLFVVILQQEGSTALSIAMQRNFKDLALLIYGNVSFDPIGKPRKVRKKRPTSRRKCCEQSLFFYNFDPWRFLMISYKWTFEYPWL